MDVLAFLEEHGIEHDPRRTYRDNVYVKCPWCKDDDESAHMGIRLDGMAYGCWRDERHRGSEMEDIVQALLGCSVQEAEDIVRGAKRNSSWDQLRERLARSDAAPETPEDERTEYPAGIAEIERRGPTVAARRYLRERGFRGKDLDVLISRYSLRFGVSGRWQRRLILPFIEAGQLVGWTGRSVGRSRIKYLTEPKGRGSKRYVMNHDLLFGGGEVIALVEGPLDALKLDFYGSAMGVRAVPLLGLSVTDVQADKIAGLAGGFRKLAVVLDATATSVALRLSRKYGVLHPHVVPVPAPWGDPGEMDVLAVRRFCRDLLST